MFAVIYRSFVKLDKEEQYRQNWTVVADYFIHFRGALGSCLHKADDGSWITYSRWPDRATRDASWPKEGAPSSDLPNDIRKAILEIKDSIDQERKFPELCLNVVDDLFISA